MKTIRRILAFALVLMLTMSLGVNAVAADNYDTLADWEIRIAVPDDTTAVLKGNEYYIYAQHEGSIPYVMLRPYRYDDAEAFLKEFTAYMQNQYSDLKVLTAPTEKRIGDKTCLETDYTYKVSGYDVKDRRIAIPRSGRVYLFTSKEIESNGMTVGSMLEDVVADCVFLGEETPEQQTESGLADAYLYCQKDGMPKYWLDFTGGVSDNPVLHCYFRSGDPTFYESCFILDMSTARITENGLEVSRLWDEYGFDHSDWFQRLSFQFYTDGVVMTAVRDERTLAGGAEDNILTGNYAMYPVGVSINTATGRPAVRPEESGPYSEEELGRWAQIFYFVNYGFFPPETEVTKNSDGSFTIHLFEIVDLDGLTHTATSAWYVVNAYGSGRNDITGERIELIG